jgi:hypothetical protein
MISQIALIQLGGGLHLCQLPGTWYLGRRLLGIDRELERLSPLVAAIVMVLGLAAVTLLVSLGGFVVMFAGELAASSFGHALIAFLGAFWLARLAVQLYYYFGLPWPRSPAGRYSNSALIAIFGAQAAAYFSSLLVGTGVGP